MGVLKIFWNRTINSYATNDADEEHMEKKAGRVFEKKLLRPFRGVFAGCCKYRIKIYLLLLFSVAACQPEVAVVPRYLIGQWETSAPDYAGRYMKISEQELVYGVGEGREVSNTIDKIEVKQNRGTVFTFYYRDPEEEKADITFTYSPDSGGTLQLKNSDHIWKKKKPGGAG